MYAGLQAPPQLHDAVAVEADATDVRAHPIFNSVKSFLGTTVGSKMDVFLENFQTAFFGNYIALFFQKIR